ncbi:MAG: hypothetical protein Q8R11_01040 [bacterium]|nr:hypothetical protein [bacterium]
MILLLVLFLIYSGIAFYTFRFQRVTLSISRKLLDYGDTNTQMILTPNWVGILGWISTGLLLVNGVLFFVFYGWVYILMLSFFHFFGLAILEKFSPIPPYGYFFEIIEKHLGNEIKNSKDKEKENFLKKMLGNVQRNKFK